jgi:ribosomal protein L35AE/L33A
MPERATGEPEGKAKSEVRLDAQAPEVSLPQFLGRVPSAEHVLQLQRTIGNAAVARAIGERRPLGGALSDVTRRRLMRQVHGPAGVVTVHFNVTVDTQVSGEEFLIRAVMQYAQVDRDEAIKKIRDGSFTCSHTACANGVPGGLVGTPVP